MEVMEAIRGLYSCRKYLDVPVEMDKLGQVLEAGRLSQSAGNLQNWRFVLVRDPAQRHLLAEAALQQRWMEEAPVHIVICSEMKRITDFYGVRGERLYAVQNCAVALSNMMLVAHSIGLGSCWVGAFDEEQVGRAINVPPIARPQAIFTLGYSADTPKDHPKYRIENITYIEKYWNRVGDIGTVLWDYRFAERGAAIAKKMAANIEKLGNKVSKDMQEKMKKKK
ncbi:MAG: nitroreductase family protein [Nanoarchaeota archaeon]